MIWTKEDGPPPEGFTLISMESGVTVLRRKRQRNLQKLGIGGFLVRARGTRGGQENDDADVSGQTTPTTETPSTSVPTTESGDKPKRKPIRRKIKSKLAETFPPYLQEAFFGKDLMDGIDFKKEVDSGAESDDEKMEHFKSIHLSQVSSIFHYMSILSLPHVTITLYLFLGRTEGRCCCSSQKIGFV